MKKLLISMICMSAMVASANTIKFDKSSLFVKMNKGEKLPQSATIQSAKNLFGDVYLVNTSNVKSLELELSKNAKVNYTERNFHAGERKLAKKVSVQKNGLEFFSPSKPFFDDPLTKNIWSFNPASEQGISINKAYISPLNLKKLDVIVAVVDTGVDYTHEDLENTMWVNKKEIAGNGVDDDGNGYIDDIHGIDTIDKDSDPADGHYHGTHVAGTIGAEQNNRIGISGIASTAKIMAVRAVPSNGDETDANVVESFLYAAKNGAKIINCSFGKTHNEGGMIVSETIKHIGETYGALVIAAAGNDSNWMAKHNIDKNKKYPASFENDHLLVIAASQKRGDLASFSNVGLKNVDLAAPGHKIYSTVVNNKYQFLSGTSMASPTTAGVAAEVLAQFPKLTPLELKKVLMDSVVKVKVFKQYMVSGGRVDLVKALNYAMINFPNKIAD